MTPKENKLIQLFYPNVQWKLGQEDCLDRAERCVLIADEFAIGFSKWMYDFKGDINKVEELLEIYKKRERIMRENITFLIAIIFLIISVWINNNNKNL